MISASVDVQCGQVELLLEESVNEVLVEGRVPGSSRLARLAADEVVHQVGLCIKHTDVVEDVVESHVPVDPSVYVSAGHHSRHHAVAKPDF